MRVAALSVAVLATMLVPYLLIRDWARQAMAAEAWVQHSVLVSDTAAQMMFHLRDMTASAYGRLAGMQTPVLQERYAASGERVERLIGDLERLTRDNPEQLVRVGQIKAMFKQRKPHFDDAVTDSDPAQRGEILARLESLVVEGNASDFALGLARAEDRLLAERTARATQLRADVEWLQTVSLFAQILLLGAIALLAERDARARRRAEHQSSEADVRNRAIFHAVHEPIALLDHELNILTRNTAFAELYGSADPGSE